MFSSKSCNRNITVQNIRKTFTKNHILYSIYSQCLNTIYQRYVQSTASRYFYFFCFAESVYFQRFAKLQCLFFWLILQFWSFLVKLSANKTTNILLIQIFPFFQMGWNLSLLLTHWYWRLFVSDVRYSSRSALMSAEIKNGMNICTDTTEGRGGEIT